MKKFFLLNAVAVLFMLLIAGSAGAQAASDFTIQSRQAVVNGRNETLPVAPYISDSRTFCPVRYIAYACGVEATGIGWDAETGTVSLTDSNGVEVRLTIGSKVLWRSGQQQEMDTVPEITENYTFLPARYVAEAFGYDVTWDAAKKAVGIVPRKTEASDAKEAETESCIRLAAQYRADGDYRQALCVLLEAYRKTNSPQIQKEIDTFWKQIEFTTILNPAACDPQHHFIDTNFANDPYMPATCEMGLVLRDKSSGNEQLLATITLHYADYWEMQDSDTHPQVYRDGKWLFTVWVGPGCCTPFLYSIPENRLIVLPEGFDEWEEYDDKGEGYEAEWLIGTTMRFAVDSTQTLAVYDWEGDVWYEYDDMLSPCIVDKRIYYLRMTYEDGIYTNELYRMQLDGSEDEYLCTIQTVGGYCTIEKETKRVVWRNDGDEQNHSMLLSAPQDVWMEMRG